MQEYARVKAEQKTREQLIDELRDLRAHIAALEAAACEHKRTEAALHESADRAWSISTLSSDYAYAYRVEPDGTLILEWATEAFSHTTGLTAQEFRAHGGWAALIHPEDQPIAAQRERTLLSGRTHTSEFRIVTRNGGVRWMRDSGRPVWDVAQERVVRIYGAAQDITSCKQVEQALRDKEERYRALFDGVPVGLYQTAPSGEILDVNLALVEILGYPDRESLLAANVPSGYANPKDRQRWADLMQCDDMVRGFEVQWLRYDGTPIWVCESARAVRDDEGRVLYYEGAVEDITAQMRALEALHETQAFLTAFLDHATMPIYAVSTDGRYHLVNRAWEECVGIGREEAIGRSIEELFPAEAARQFGEADRQVVESTAQVVVEQSIDTAGGPRTFHTVSFPLYGATGQIDAVGGISLDITDRKQLTEALRLRAEQLESLRQVRLKLAAQLDLDVLLYSIACQVIAVSGGDRGGFYLYRPERDVLEWVVSIGPDMVPLGSTLRRGEGVAGEVWESGKPLIVDNYKHVKKRAPAWEGHPAYAVVCAPIHWGQEFLGVLGAAAEPPQTFSAADADMLALLATEAAVAIVHARLFEQAQAEIAERKRAEEKLRQQTRRLGVLREMDRAILTARSSEDIAQAALDYIRTLVPYRDAHVILFDLEAEELECLATRGTAETVLSTGMRVSLTAELLERIKQFCQDRVQMADDAPSWLPLAEAMRSHLAWGARSFASAPLAADGKLLGALNLGSHRLDAFRRKDLEIVREVAAPLAIAIRQARLFEAAYDAREQMRSLAGYLEDAREAERTRIAREIHDEFGQVLTALKMDVAWLSRRLPGAPLLMDKTKAMSDLIDATIQTMRRVVTELRPDVLDNLGLVAALEWQAQEFAERTGIDCELRLGKEEFVLDRDQATAIFRIFQETLTNIARHAGATQVYVDLKEHSGSLVLGVVDNGRGITRQQLSAPASLGLIGMRERARAYGGTVTLFGIPEQGTTVVVRMPLKHPEEDHDDPSAHRR